MRRFIYARAKRHANALTPSQKIWLKMNCPQNFTTWLVKFKRNFDILSPFTPYKRVDASYFVDELVRKYIRSLILVICGLQKKGLCLHKKTLHADNLEVLDETIRLKILYVKKYSVARGKRDFQNLRKLIMETFFADKDHSLIPHDMQNLLDHLEQYDSKKEHLISNHFALMSDQGKEGMITRWDTIRKQFTKPQHKTFKVACSKLPGILNEIRKLDKDDPFQIVLEEGSKKNKAEMSDQPRYFRNLVQHLILHSRIGLDQYQEPNYTCKDVVKMTMAMFSENISLFFELLYDNGLLELMNPEDFF